MPVIMVVGVVDVRRAAGRHVNAQVYLPAAQTNRIRCGSRSLRSDGDPRSLAPAIQQDVWAIDKDLPVTNVDARRDPVSARPTGVFRRCLPHVRGPGADARRRRHYGVVAYAAGATDARDRRAHGARRRPWHDSPMDCGTGRVAGRDWRGGVPRRALALTLRRGFFEVGPTDAATMRGCGGPGQRGDRRESAGRPRRDEDRDPVIALRRYNVRSVSWPNRKRLRSLFYLFRDIPNTQPRAAERAGLGAGAAHDEHADKPPFVSKSGEPRPLLPSVAIAT